ncbi:MAG: ketol-acid reductoisomerase [Phycisphaerae bacterium]|nr:ketol-acid reductoisomerase [Phycisphaerae bacterium]
MPPDPLPPPLPVLRGDDAAPLTPLAGRRVALLGFGNQGRAHALNLRDSGVEVIVGGRRDGRGVAQARAEGFVATTLAEAASSGDLVVVALPDEAHQEAFRQHLDSAIQRGATLGFLHGFSLRFGLVSPRADLGIVLVAPKGPGTTLRERFVEGLGIPALFAVHRESARNDARGLALAWANGIGSARAGIIETSFADEAETDLFGEQTVLCGGLVSLVKVAYETLVAAGYPPELAYLECCHEVKQVADLVYTRGIAGMRDAISNTAEFGSFECEERLATPAIRAEFRRILDEIRDGRFAGRLVQDHANGDPWLTLQRRAGRVDSIESVGERVRALMPWLATNPSAERAASAATPTPTLPRTDPR